MNQEQRRFARRVRLVYAVLVLVESFFITFFFGDMIWEAYQQKMFYCMWSAAMVPIYWRMARKDFAKLAALVDAVKKDG